MLPQLLPQLVALHGIGGRGDLPVPTWLAVYSAGAAVAVSFFALGAFWSRPRFELVSGRPVRALTKVVDHPATRVTLKVAGVLALGVLLGAAWFGDPDPSRNPAPTWLYVWIWVGIIPLALLCGPIWRIANPLRTLAALIPRASYRRLPDGIAYWPAVAGLAAFLWLELVYPEGSDPRIVALAGTAYAIVNVAAGIVFGPAWFGIGDSFEVYAEVLARLSPLGRGSDGVIGVRNPLAGLATMPRRTGIVGLLCLLLGSTAFDGISRWSAWTQRTGELGKAQHLLVYTLGLAVAVAIVTGLFLAGAVGLPKAFAHSLVPIAIGYAVAHYFSFAMFQGQAGWLLATDPFGRGWDLLGTSGARIDYAFLTTGVIAGVQIGAIVLGHVLGVVSAHDRAAGLFRRRRLRRAQYPMLAAMIAFTAGGIALVTAS
ncbi:hypothetical protein PWY87_22740 [Kribbella solani]|uniref:hypothetical protein n=1 Tax=Kribbella solani TaxID=236067 RepID=UPI0029B5401A|nr:hypothetical protein [Kribbella solani]MDX2973135.1 hypothetical protein [Kribbella solani]MDX3004524.1 hypothetical protein [Kribbella solani]